MRISRHISHLFLLCILPFAVNASTTPFSQHGIIQNVQNYSSNPFWNPNGPYNQRMPMPVYAMGTDIETDECQRIVASLVAAQCTTNNNCKSTQLSDIRPAIMLQLSRIPGGNYATACAGFIDTAYNDYINKTATTVPNYPVAFPTSTATNPNVINPSYQIPNPTPIMVPDWELEMMGRNAEIRALESETATQMPGLVATEFPKTYADLSFSERMAIETAGYEPYKDKRAYTELKIQDAAEYEVEKQTIAQHKNAYCQSATKKYAILKSDLEKLKQCRTKNIPFNQCKLQGTY